MRTAPRAVIAAVALFCFAAFGSGTSAAEGKAAQQDAVKTVADTSAPGESPAGLPKMSDKDLQSLLDRLENTLGKIRTLEARFVQEKKLSIFRDIVKSEGLLVFQRPDRVRFEITEPFQSAIVTNGKSAARYELVDGAWKKLDAVDAEVMAMVTGQICSWIEGRFREKSDVYEISALASTPVTVVLTPRNERFRKYIEAIELSLAPDETKVTAVTVREPGGDSTVMRFTHERRDRDIPPEVFDVTAAAPVAVAGFDTQDGGAAEEDKPADKGTASDEAKN